MPAHIRTALTTTSLGLSFDRGRLVLGTWQAVYLWERCYAGMTGGVGVPMSVSSAFRY